MTMEREAPSQQPTIPTVSDRNTDDLYNALQNNAWAGGNILRGEFPRMVTMAAAEFAALTARVEFHRWFFQVLGGTGVTDKVYVCIKNAADTYVFQEFGAAEANGTIKMYVGLEADVPTGWHICDGTGGTVDFRDKFILGGTYAQIGTTATQQNTVISNHNVNIITSQTIANVLVQDGTTSNEPANYQHDHTVTGTLTHSVATQYFPPYYKLAFIQKVS